MTAKNSAIFQCRLNFTLEIKGLSTITGMISNNNLTLTIVVFVYDTKTMNDGKW